MAREPAELCATFAAAAESVSHPNQRLAFDCLIVVGPEHGRVLGEAGSAPITRSVEPWR